MNTTSVTSRGARRLVAVAVLGVALALAGCAQTPAPAPSPTATTAPAPAPTTTAPTTAAPTTPSPAPPSDAFTCDEILPTSVLDDALGSTFTAATSYVPQGGSPAAELAAAGGAACEWTDGTGATVVLAAGIPDAATMKAAENEASRAGESTDAFGASLTSYVSGEGGTTIDVFGARGAWIHTTSPLYTSPDVAAPLVTQVMQALPS